MKILTTILLTVGAVAAWGSDGREAPFISRHPSANAMDLYLFRNYEPGREDMLVLMGNFQPLQLRESGPLYYPLDPDTLYEFHLDTNGDCREDKTFQFRFKNEVRDIKFAVGDKEISAPGVLTGPVSATDESRRNLLESYTVTLVNGDRRAGSAAPVLDSRTGSKSFAKPLDFVGPKTFGSSETYKSYSESFIHPIRLPGCGRDGRVFAGQREHITRTNSAVYDLFNIDVTSTTGGYDDLHGISATLLALELPVECVVGSSMTVGAWASASMRQARLLNPQPSAEKPSLEGGAWTQVSRVGNPLVNSLVIGLPHKDAFNASRPHEDDAFLDYFTHPTLPAILASQFGFQAPPPPRNDWAAAFLKGFARLNQTPGRCDMLRLNLSFAPVPHGRQRSSGALYCFDSAQNFSVSRSSCDAAGFPNGRRPADDATDIVLRIGMGAWLPASEAPDNHIPFSDRITIGSWRFFPNFPFATIPRTHDDPPFPP